jgi:hypothetical protein
LLRVEQDVLRYIDDDEALECEYLIEAQDLLRRLVNEVPFTCAVELLVA